jgi:hypothetical protein
MTLRNVFVMALVLGSQLAGFVSHAGATVESPPPVVFYKPTESNDSEQSRFTLDLSPEYFIWRESNEGVTVRETGPRFQLGLSYRERKDEGWLFGATIRGYYGNVQYDGFNQVFDPVAGTITLVPLTARTEYLGGLVEAQALWKQVLSERYAGSWKGTLGFDIWDRSLNGSGGYHELWTVAYGRAGYELAPKAGHGWTGDLGLKMPFYVANTAEFSGFGHIRVRPRPRPIGYAEAGYRFSDALALTAYFDGYWFAKSAVVDGLFQPESTQYQFGLRLKWSFQ